MIAEIAGDFAVEGSNIYDLGCSTGTTMLNLDRVIAKKVKFVGSDLSSFDDYCSRVNRVVPKLTGIGATSRGVQFNWRRLVSAEYGTTFVWIAASFS